MPYIQAAVIRADGVLLSQHAFWDSTHSYAYPSASMNSRGEGAGTIYRAGPGSFLESLFFLYDDAADTFLVGSLHSGDASPPVSRWGDYFTTKQNPNYTATWVSATAVPKMIDGRVQAAGSFDWFGRVKDFPVAGLFYSVTPCRVVDTRETNGPYGGPPLAANVDRTFVISGHCGVPSSATAVSLNFTVAQPTSLGDLRAFPAGAGLPVVSALNWRAGQVRANNAIVGLGASGDVSVHPDQATGTLQLIIDVTGYFQ